MDLSVTCWLVGQALTVNRHLHLSILKVVYMPPSLGIGNACMSYPNFMQSHLVVLHCHRHENLKPYIIWLYFSTCLSSLLPFVFTCSAEYLHLAHISDYELKYFWIFKYANIWRFPVALIVHTVWGSAVQVEFFVCVYTAFIHNFRDWGAIWSKSNFRPTDQHHPWSSPFQHSRDFLNASRNLCSMKVFSTACSSALTTWAVLKWSYLQSWKQRSDRGQVRRVGWMGDGSHIVLVKKVSLKKEVWDCIVMMWLPVLTLLKFGGEVLTLFHTVTIKHHNRMWNWPYGLPRWIHCEQSHWYQSKW